MSDLTPGSEFAGCRIETIRGRGGMGVVYRARELSLDRPVAIKLINDEQAGDADAHRRFEREARLMASIDHPNVIPVYAAGEEDGHLYLVMRYVDGTDLQALLRSAGRLPAQQGARITDQVARALDAAHQQGLVHRDIKPSNVLLSGNHAYLTDFGITRLVDERTSSTDAGKWVGTFDYMSPEQLRGETVGPRSDVYSLGCLLYSCLVGSPPLHRGTTAATITAQLHEEPPSIAHVPGVPKQFDEVIRRALAKRPRDRYASAGQLGAAALAAALGHRDRPWRFGRRSLGTDLGPSLAPLPVSASPSGRGSARVAEPAAATVVRDDADTKLFKTAVMPLPTEVAPPRVDLGHDSRSRRKRPYVLGAALAAALVAAALAVGVIELSTDRASKGTGPLTTADITKAVHQFATDYSKRDLHSLARLLASDVSRVDPSSTQHGHTAVLEEYEAQFTTKPVPARYVLSHLTVTSGWAGRAQAQYALTVSGGATLSGHVVFGLQRDRNRIQVALISTQ
ncbi:MAG TPA: serine/threonine-protein kinase [Solirubrobacteraceae bacterium]|nr:serine/threonine-protein kinase [Solirubrobacteraceae bacterium]